MTAPALRKIATELDRLADNAATEPVDPFELRVIARKVGAQAEIIERGLADG